jgi:Flavin-binding monooxygenase-like
MSVASSSLHVPDDVPRRVAPKIGVIGAGAAGLVAARILSRRLQRRNESDNFTFTVFEKDDDVAGVWNYQPTSTKYRPMYRNLRTNLPKEIMAFREFPWPSTTEQSFVSHFEVAKYLHTYCDHFQLQQYVHTGCNVQHLSCLPNTKSLFSPHDDSDCVWPQIQLTVKCSETAKDAIATASIRSEIFDAVFICNGHYSLPAVPKIPGLHEYFRGTILHSIEYDEPSVFGGKSVLCIGGRASGSDLAREIAATGAMVYLSDTAFKGDHPVTENNVTWLPKTSCILKDGSVQFECVSNFSRVIEPVKVDTIILCTGYDYNFPFIDSKSNLLHLNASQRRVQPLFEQLWHANFPNVAFIGLPHSVIPFPLFEYQVEAVDCSWFDRAYDDTSRDSTHSLQFPDTSERYRIALLDSVSGGWKESRRVLQDTHYLGSGQWDYCRRLAKYAGIYDAVIEAYISTNHVSVIICLNFFNLLRLCII